jgi:hypothetical protein
MSLRHHAMHNALHGITKSKMLGAWLDKLYVLSGCLGDHVGNTNQLMSVDTSKAALLSDHLLLSPLPLKQSTPGRSSADFFLY